MRATVHRFVWLRVTALAAVWAFVLATFASAGALPASVQDALAAIGSRVGIDVPGSAEFSPPGRIARLPDALGDPKGQPGVATATPEPPGPFAATPLAPTDGTAAAGSAPADGTRAEPWRTWPSTPLSPPRVLGDAEHGSRSSDATSKEAEHHGKRRRHDNEADEPDD